MARVVERYQGLQPCILQVLVEPGQQVEEGETLVIMEAMKMEVEWCIAVMKSYAYQWLKNHMLDQVFCFLFLHFQHVIRAPKAGFVDQVFYFPGEAVDRHAQLVQFQE